MKLKAVVTSLDEVPEAARDYYTEQNKDDTTIYVLDVEGFRTHPDVTALANAHDRTKRRVTELTTENTLLRERAEQLPEDFDPDLYQRAVTEGVGGGSGEPKNADQIRQEVTEAVTRRLEDKHKKEREKDIAERDRFRTQLENRVRRDALDEALEANGVTDPAYKRGARAILMPTIEIHDQDGELVALAKSPEYGDTVPVAEHVKAWAGTDEGKAYVSARDSAGSGANGAGNGGTPPSSEQNPWKQGEHFNLTKQAQLKREDPAKAERMMREAGMPVIR